MTTNTTPAVERLENWLRRAMRFIDLCDADTADYEAGELHEEAEHLLRVGFDLWGFDPDGRSAHIDNININPHPILASLASPAPVSEPVAGSGEAVDREARRLYIAETANDPAMHCNRFPSWEEMSDAAKEPYRLRAALGEKARRRI